MQPESVAQRISIAQPLRQRHTGKLITLLLLCNVAVLTYFLFPKPQSPSPATPQEKPATPALAPVAKPSLAPHAETNPQPLPAARPLEQTPASIATMVEARIVPPPAPAPAQKPALLKKPLPAPEKPAIVPPPPTPTIRNEETVAAPKEIISKPAPIALKSDLPYLEDLPADLRRSLPTLTINVFSYSPAPAQRFVMINMVKYVPGQRIKDLLDLQEIREDSIVVAYNAVTFKIKRP